MTTTTTTTAAGAHRRRDSSQQPIVAAVDGSSASRAAMAEAVRLAAELDAPVVFAYARRGPSSMFGAPVYQRRLARELAHARRVLDRALSVAASSGIAATAEVLEGSPRRRILELARARHARLVVVGKRRRRLGRSVSGAIVAGAGRPVLVAKRLQRLAAAR